MHTAAPRGICRVTHTPLTLLPPSCPPVLPRLLQSPPPCRPGTPGCPGRVGSHQPDSSAPPEQRQGQRRPARQRQRGRRWRPQTLPDPIPTELTSKTICSGGRGPCRAAGQKQPAPGWPRAGLQGPPGQEAWLAFPLQLPARLDSRGARLSAQTLPDGGPRDRGHGRTP